MEDKIDQETALILYTAAVVGAPYLAVQLERIGWSEPADALQDARLFRRDLLREVEKARKEKNEL
jgi:hypothetical protein